MANPKVLDFSAEQEEAVTIVFPDGETTCELPTADQLTIPALQFLTANGQEWGSLFEKSDLTAAERKRFDHLNKGLIEALLDVPKAKIATLNDKQKATIIMSFMTASPALQAMMKDLQEQPEGKAAAPIMEN